MTTHFVRLLLLTTLFGGAAAAADKLTIEFEKNTACNANQEVIKETKECKTGGSCFSNGKYEMSHANIYFVNETNGKINGIAGCRLTHPDKACSSIGKEVGKAYLLLIVTLRQSSAEDQNVHYMYHEAIFGLTKLTPPGNPSNIHGLTNFIFVKKAKYGAHTFNGGSCSSNTPKAVISGHGYFIAKMDSQSNTWENMYYLPQYAGQYIFTPK